MRVSPCTSNEGWEVVGPHFSSRTHGWEALCPLWKLSSRMNVSARRMGPTVTQAVIVRADQDLELLWSVDTIP